MSKVKISVRHNARKKTLQALYQWVISESAISEIESQFLSETPDENFDRAYFKKLFREISTEPGSLDSAYSPYLDRACDDLDPIELCILRLGSYELISCPDVPYRVVINEALELAKAFGATESHKFINGVLDKLAQQVRSVEFGAKP